MKKWGSIWRVSLVLILAALTLAGCGGRAIQDRSDASAPEAITIEMQAPQPKDTAPQQETQEQAQAQEQAESPVLTPTQTAQQPSADTTDSELDELMDELETVLDDLDETIRETDSDSLTDAALAALGK